jgi:hypothetical protein
MKDEAMIVWHEWLDSAADEAVGRYADIADNGYTTERDAREKGGILKPKRYKITLTVEEAPE